MIQPKPEIVIKTYISLSINSTNAMHSLPERISSQYLRKRTVHQIGQSKDQGCERHILRSNVVWEHLTVKDVAADVNSKLVNSVETEQGCYA